MNELDFIYKRVSIRSFKDQDITIEDLKRIIEGCHLCPIGLQFTELAFCYYKE